MFIWLHSALLVYLKKKHYQTSECCSKRIFQLTKVGVSKFFPGSDLLSRTNWSFHVPNNFFLMTPPISISKQNTSTKHLTLTMCSIPKLHNNKFLTTSLKTLSKTLFKVIVCLTKFRYQRQYFLLWANFLWKNPHHCWRFYVISFAGRRSPA